MDLNGRGVKLTDRRGDLVLLNFWAVWCGYCRTEFPVIEAFYDRHKTEGFTVLAINVQEDPDRVREFVDDMGLGLPVLLDRQGEVTARYRVRGLPTSFLIGRDGTILEKHIGPVDQAMLERYLAQAGVQ